MTLFFTAGLHRLLDYHKDQRHEQWSGTRIWQITPQVVSFCGMGHVNLSVSSPPPSREPVSSFGMPGRPSLTYWYFLVVDHMLEAGHCCSFIMLAAPANLSRVIILQELGTAKPQEDSLSISKHINFWADFPLSAVLLGRVLWYDSSGVRREFRRPRAVCQESFGIAYSSCYTHKIKSKE